MILERVPDEVAAEKRRKLKTDKQNKRKNISKERLAFCDVNAYITNADQDVLPTELIRSVYLLDGKLRSSSKHGNQHLTWIK
ncbi:MAG: hypothetical protein U5Q03_17180 [Bacteroidota bacterium]|nr:hypothetical protein [Bacteroidota bacterium]